MQWGPMILFGNTVGSLILIDSNWTYSKVKNPNWPEENQLTIYKRDRRARCSLRHAASAEKVHK